MNAASNPRELKPGQAVLVFKPEESKSDVPRGYPGTVVELDRASVAKHPRRADRWKYIIHVHSLGGWYRVRASHIVATGDE